MSIIIEKGIAPPKQRFHIEAGVAPPPVPARVIRITPTPRQILPLGHPSLTLQQIESHNRLRDKWAERNCSLPKTCPLCRCDIKNTVYEASSSDLEFRCSWPDCGYEWR